MIIVSTANRNNKQAYNVVQCITFTMKVMATVNIKSVITQSEQLVMARVRRRQAFTMGIIIMAIQKFTTPAPRLAY